MDSPAFEKSAALWSIVTPTPIAPTDNVVVEAFIPIPSNTRDVWIPTVPVLVTKILSLVKSFILTGLLISGFVPIPIDVIFAWAAVTIPAIAVSYTHLRAHETLR